MKSLTELYQELARLRELRAACTLPSQEKVYTDRMSQIFAEIQAHHDNRGTALLYRLRFYMLWRWRFVPEIVGVRWYWQSRTQLDGVPYRIVTVPRRIVFLPDLSVETNSDFPLVPGDTLKLTIYKDLPTVTSQ